MGVWFGAGGGGVGSMQALLLGEVITHNFGITVYCTYLQIRTADLSCSVCFGSILFLVESFTFFCLRIIIVYYHTKNQKKRKFKQRIKLNYNVYVNFLVG